MRVEESIREWCDSYYGITVHRVEVVQMGVHVVFKVCDAQGCERFLKAHHPGKPYADIDFECRVASALSGHAQCGTAAPLFNRAGVWSADLALDGEMRHACLFDAAPGHRCSFERDDQLRLLRSLAHFHRALDAGGLDGDIRHVDPLARCARIQAMLRASPLLDAATLAHCEAMLDDIRARLGPGRGPARVLCHGDPWPGNAFVHRERVVWIDLEACGRSEAAQDLAVLLFHLTADGRLRAEALDDFLRDCRDTGHGAVSPARLGAWLQLHALWSLWFLLAYRLASRRVLGLWLQVRLPAVNALARTLQSGHG